MKREKSEERGWRGGGEWREERWREESEERRGGGRRDERWREKTEGRRGGGRRVKGGEVEGGE